jgi:pimeloyl-ACP methyl ester carboxylesterase
MPRGGNGQPVIVVPGFLAPDMSTGRLRDFLIRQNFRARLLDGRNQSGADAPGDGGGARTKYRETAERVGRPVSLVGISLGGTIARQAAKNCPDSLARVITVVSPIRMPVVTPLAPLAQADSAAVGCGRGETTWRRITEPPPVPLTAIISRDDGIIEWAALAVPQVSAQVEVVEVGGRAYVDLLQPGRSAHHRRPAGAVLSRWRAGARCA